MNSQPPQQPPDTQPVPSGPFPPPSQPFSSQYSQPLPSPPGWQPPYQPMPPQRPAGRFGWYRRQRTAAKVIIAGVGGLLVLCICIVGIAAVASNGNQGASSTPTSAPVVQVSATASGPTNMPGPTNTPKPTATATPQPSHYPPKTEADLHALASKGDASAIHEFDSETVGLVSCPQPKREVTVDPSITDEHLAEDLLAYFYANQLDSPCGSVVFAYHNQSEAGNAYTAGRIIVDTQNNDPNNTNAQRTLTLDIGGNNDPNAQEYMVTY